MCSPTGSPSVASRAAIGVQIDSRGLWCAVALEALRRSDFDGALGAGLRRSRFCWICFRDAADLPAHGVLNTEVVLC